MKLPAGSYKITKKWSFEPQSLESTDAYLHDILQVLDVFALSADDLVDDVCACLVLADEADAVSPHGRAGAGIALLQALNEVLRRVFLIGS